MTTAEMLRSYIPDGDGYNSDFAHHMEQAASEIERLEADNRKLRDALDNLRKTSERFLFECALALAEHGPIDATKEGEPG